MSSFDCLDCEPWLNPSEVDAFVKSIDKDSNGKISFKEYMNWLLGSGWFVEGSLALTKSDMKAWFVP